MKRISYTVCSLEQLQVILRKSIRSVCMGKKIGLLSRLEMMPRSWCILDSDVGVPKQRNGGHVGVPTLNPPGIELYCYANVFFCFR